MSVLTKVLRAGEGKKVRRLAELVREGQAGVVCAPTGEALAEGIDRLQRDWDEYAARARVLAERWFGLERFLVAYDRIYRELVS